MRRVSAQSCIIRKAKPNQGAQVAVGGLGAWECQEQDQNAALVLVPKRELMGISLLNTLLQTKICF